jgi:hypothetical protein
MLSGKISALKYFPNCFWDSVEGQACNSALRLFLFTLWEVMYKWENRVLRLGPCLAHLDNTGNGGWENLRLVITVGRSGIVGGGTASPVGTGEVRPAVPAPTWRRGLNRQRLRLLSIRAFLRLLSLAHLLSLTSLPCWRRGSGTGVADSGSMLKRDSCLTQPRTSKTTLTQTPFSKQSW